MNDKSFTLHGGQIASLSGSVKTPCETSAEGFVLTAPLREETIRPCSVKAPSQPSCSVNIDPSDTVITLILQTIALDRYE